MEGKYPTVKDWRQKYPGIKEGDFLHPEWIDKEQPGRVLKAHARSPYRWDHLCILVNNLEEAIGDFNDLFEIEKADWITGLFTEKVEEGKIGDWMVGAMCSIRAGGGSDGCMLLELIQPGNPEGAMAKQLEKRGEGFHHVSINFPSKMRKGQFKRWADKGFMPIGDPEYGIGGSAELYGGMEPLRYTQLHPKYRLHRAQFEVIERLKYEYKPNEDEWLRGEFPYGGISCISVDEF